jgi:hypothetical protein
MTTEDWYTNNGAFTEQAAEAAGLTAAKTAAQTVVKATTRTTKRATKLAVDSVAAGVDATVQAVKATAESNAAAGEAATKATEEATKAALDNATRVLASAVEAGKAAAETSVNATATATKVATEAAENAATAFGALATEKPSFEVASQKVQEQTDALIAQAKQAAAAWLDLYDQGFAAFVELRTSLAKASQIDAVIDLANTNTQALEQLNASFTSAVRDLLK